jgi:hypothetical protein
MTRLGHIVYRWRLSKWPAQIPYEKLSRFTAWKLQQQGELHDLTLMKLVRSWFRRAVANRIHGWWWRLHDYEEDGVVFNSLAAKFYYVHSEPGLTRYLGGSPCKPGCRYCKKQTNACRR